MEVFSVVSGAGALFTAALGADSVVVLGGSSGDCLCVDLGVSAGVETSLYAADLAEVEDIADFSGCCFPAFEDFALDPLFVLFTGVPAALFDSSCQVGEKVHGNQSAG